jgi:hypothetical protein
MKQLAQVPARYRTVLEHIFTDYADAVRALEHREHGSISLEVEFDRGETLRWHYLTEGGEILEGKAPEKPARLLDIRVTAEPLRAAMESGKSIREVAFASGVQVRGDIDFAFRVLAAAEKVRARSQQKEHE